MTTTAQGALTAFMNARKTISISSINSTYLVQYEKLKVAAEQESEANRVESETANAAAQTAQLTAMIDTLKSIGFLCDNGQTDWNKLYNRPKIFSANWQAQATYQKGISTGVTYFVQKAYEVLYVPYTVNAPVLVGETFVYNGQLYEVIQAHTTQLNWNPETTPALYKKAVLAGTVSAWVQPIGSTDAYKKGDRVTFNGSTYESLIDANVWSPTVYPAGWKIV